MKIAIIGCGYIGSTLAISLTKAGHFVTALTNKPQKLSDLNHILQKVIIAPATDREIISDIIQNNEIIILTIATANLNEYKNTFLQGAATIRAAALETAVARTLIYTSDCMVYGEHHGQWVDEKTSLHPITTEAHIIIETEKILSSLKSLDWKITILRLTEIYGPGREIVKKVKKCQGKVMPGKENFYTNMIHQQDVIGCVEYMITHKLQGIYNLSDDDHPLKQQFYDEITQKYHLETILWNKELSGPHNGNKRISTHKIKAAGYNVFHYPHRIL